jgi:hypothetical protein
MAGAACAERHLHASDLAVALRTEYRPADGAAILAGWLAGMPHLRRRLLAGLPAATGGLPTRGRLSWRPPGAASVPKAARLAVHGPAEPAPAAAEKEMTREARRRGRQGWLPRTG